MLRDIYTSMPAECFSLFTDAKVSGLGSGKTSRDADSEGFRAVRRAGWYQTSNGWERLTPDLRNRINVRQAVEQPDGTFVIQDVDVFYPNAVKGTEDEAHYTPERIARAIANTNRAIESGGQRPGLTLGHPNIASKAMGVEPKAFGKAVNFRESDRGQGWARCDLVEIDPEVVSEWKKGRYGGLSAGIVHDAADLNIRFGHVALLGADAQALSALPSVEVFSHNQVCFSADPSTFTKGKTMGRKERAAALASRFDALSAAFKAQAADEPGSDSKVTEAFAAYADEMKKFEGDEMPMLDLPKDDEDELGDEMSEEHPDEDQDIELLQNLLGEDEGDEMCGGKYEAANPAEKTVLPDDKTLANSDEPKPTIKESENAANFAALSADTKALRKENKTLRTAVAALYGRQMRDGFRSYMKNLQDAGHQFDAGIAMTQFEAVATDKSAVTSLKKLLESTPKKDRSLVDASADGPTFSAGDTSPRKSAPVADDDAVMQILRKGMPGVNFDASDLKLGSLAFNSR